MAMIDVKAFGAIGDGIADDRSAIQCALDAGRGGEVYIPEGVYRIPYTLYVSSHTAIRAHENARIFHCGSTQKRRGDFLLSNRGPDDCDISITGGIWDGNFDGVNNTKNPDLFDPDACSGSTLNFVGVKNLSLSDMRVVNSVVYFVRLGDIDGFRIERITFGAKRLSFNQDGLHFGGGCRNGVVSDIRAFDNETNDDMIALNADDSIVRLENRDLRRDDIENITFTGIHAKNCYTAVRMLSVNHAIRNITFHDVECGCRHYAINMDGARYCRTPLFSEEDMPRGCGLIENVSFEGMKVFSSDENIVEPLICAETRCRNFSITGFERVLEHDCHPENPTVRARNLVDSVLTVCRGSEVRRYDMCEKSATVGIEYEFDSLRIDQQ